MAQQGGRWRSQVRLMVGHCYAATMGKLITLLYLHNRAILFGTSNRAVAVLRPGSRVGVRAVLSEAVMGARKIFFPKERSKFKYAKKSTTFLVVALKTQVFLGDALLSSKTFLVVTLKTQVFTVTTNAQNILQHFQGGGKCPQNIYFFRRGRLCSWKGGRLCHGTMAQWPVHLCWEGDRRHE